MKRMWDKKELTKIINDEGPSGGGLTDAPSDGKLYGRKNGNWVELPAVVELTQAQYDALSVYDNNTYYMIVDA